MVVILEGKTTTWQLKSKGDVVSEGTSCIGGAKTTETKGKKKQKALEMALVENTTKLVVFQASDAFCLEYQQMA